VAEDRVGRPRKRDRASADEVWAHLRAHWDKAYGRKRGPEFSWSLEAPAGELVALLDRGVVPIGPSLDLGCGTGVATSYIYVRGLRPTVGLDISIAGVYQARDYARRHSTCPQFVVAAAPVLPFADASFAFVFDRGCMHALSEALWPLHLREIERTLRAGGVVQLWEKEPSPTRLRELAPASFEVLSLESAPFVIAGRGSVQITHGVFRKTG
jgi:SAM-dependent methyltransferase